MPIGMVGFAMLMYLRESLGNFALAGTAVGINFVAMAACPPIQGRLIDRHGPAPLAAGDRRRQPLALRSACSSRLHAPPFWLVALFAGLSGVFASPITTITRTMWRTRFDREEDRAPPSRSTRSRSSSTSRWAGDRGRRARAVGRARRLRARDPGGRRSAAIYILSGVLSLFRRWRAASGTCSARSPSRGCGWCSSPPSGSRCCFGFLEVGYPAYATFLATPALGGHPARDQLDRQRARRRVYGGMHFMSPVERQFAVRMALMAVPARAARRVLQPVSSSPWSRSSPGR
jgi:hypothetical protein